MARPLKLNACYFSHDAGMRNHRKVKALRTKYGHMGYSVWCMLLETLTDADLFQTDCTELDIELMSADFMVTNQELTDVIDYCVKLGLLARSEDGKISCPSLKERLTSVLRRKSSDLQRKNPELLQQKLSKNEEVSELLQQKPDKNGVSDEFPLINKKKKKEKETFSMCIVNNTSSNAGASEASSAASIEDYYNSQVSLRGARLRQSKGLTKKRRQSIGARLKEYGVEKVKECVTSLAPSHSSATTHTLHASPHVPPHVWTSPSPHSHSLSPHILNLRHKSHKRRPQHHKRRLQHNSASCPYSLGRQKKIASP